LACAHADSDPWREFGSGDRWIRTSHAHLDTGPSIADGRPVGVHPNVHGYSAIRPKLADAQPRDGNPRGIPLTQREHPGFHAHPVDHRLPHTWPLQEYGGRLHRGADHADRDPYRRPDYYADPDQHGDADYYAESDEHRESHDQHDPVSYGESDEHGGPNRYADPNQHFDPDKHGDLDGAGHTNADSLPRIGR